MDSESKFHNAKTVITGAGSGIGRATAIKAAKRGARLVLTDINADGLDAVVREIRALRGTVLAAEALDLTDVEAVEAFAAGVHAGHGSVDIVMNIAGISTWGPIERLEHRHWERTIDIDLMGPITVMRVFVGPMVEAGRGGHIVNVSSAAGLLGLPWHAPYSAAKFGLRGVSEVLRFDLRRHGIGVSLVCPGGVDTPLVGTVDIVGLDRDHPAFTKTISQFKRHAVTPEKAAAIILKGVERNTYLVFTSPDIWAAHMLQRVFPPGYEVIMRVLNARMSAMARRAPEVRGPAAAPAPRAAEREEAEITTG